ncbi:MAG: acyl--CoA ligase [Alphaproteobacteria bacterium]|nr:acyl--CoA ligase [Alphaproteobacteria bacterium]
MRESRPRPNADIASAPAPGTFRSVEHWLRTWAAASPEKTFLQSIDQGTSISWGALARLTDRFARFCQARGIKANDRIAVLTDNSLENLVLYFAVMRTGATYCTVNVEIQEAHLREMLTRLEPKLVLWDKTLDPALLGVGSPGAWIPFGACDPGGHATDGGLFEAVDALGDGPALPSLGGPDDLALISFTSGTSAKPKGVMHSFDDYQRIAEQTIAMWGLGPRDRLLEYRSFSWASSHMLCLHPCLIAGATLLFARRFSQSRFFDWVRDLKPTISIGVPTVINMLLERPIDVRTRDLASLRFMSSSTAPLMLEQHRRFEETYGIRLVQLYGMSEGGVVAGNHPDTRRIGSVGRPGLYQNLRVVDETGGALPEGAVGEIEIGGAQTAYGYLLEDKTVQVIRGTRLKTGDLGYLDGDGFLHVTGRAKDLIIRGGVNIAPLEIDNVLIEHPDIAEAATVGVPDPIYGEAVVCYVAPKAGRALDEAAVRAHTMRHLAEFKQPKAIVFVAAILKNDRGKVDRNGLVAAWKKTQPPG